MSFFYSKLEHQTKKKLPIRGRRLLLRGARKRRLQLLREFEVGRVYTFYEIAELDDLPEHNTLWGDDDLPQEFRI